MAHFEADGDSWTLGRHIRDRVRFRKFNLLHSFASLPGPFDVIFVRNVFIYFALETRTQIFAKLYDILRPDGYLFIGGAETALGTTRLFRAVPDRPYYVPVSPGAASAPTGRAQCA